MMVKFMRFMFLSRNVCYEYNRNRKQGLRSLASIAYGTGWVLTLLLNLKNSDMAPASGCRDRVRPV